MEGFSHVWMLKLARVTELLQIHSPARPFVLHPAHDDAMHFENSSRNMHGLFDSLESRGYQALSLGSVEICDNVVCDVTIDSKRWYHDIPVQTGGVNIAFGH